METGVESVQPVAVGRDAVSGLVAEAVGLEFGRAVNDKYAIQRTDRKLTSPFDLALADAHGPCLDLARSDDLLDAIKGFIGTKGPVRPSCTYLAYATGSYIGLHTDRVGCDANFLLLLAGGATVAELAFDLRSRDMDELLTVSRRGKGFAEYPQRIDLEGPGSGIIFDSRRVPHQRRPSSKPLLLLSICYEVL